MQWFTFAIEQTRRVAWDFGQKHGYTQLFKGVINQEERALLNAS